MDIKTFDKAFAILQAIDRLNAEKERLSHIMNKDEFALIMQDKNGTQYLFIEDYLPENYLDFVVDYGRKIDEKIKAYNEEFKNL